MITIARKLINPSDREENPGALGTLLIAGLAAVGGYVVYKAVKSEPASGGPQMNPARAVLRGATSRPIVLGGRTYVLDMRHWQDDGGGKLTYQIPPEHTSDYCRVQAMNGVLYICCDTDGYYNCVPLPILFPGDTTKKKALGYTSGSSAGQGCFATAIDGQLWLCCQGNDGYQHCFPIPITIKLPPEYPGT